MTTCSYLAALFLREGVMRDARTLTDPAERAQAFAQVEVDHPMPIRFTYRRTPCASALIANGQSVLVVQSMLGHSSASDTLDLYGHLFPDAEGNARTAMDATFNRRPAALRLTR